MRRPERLEVVRVLLGGGDDDRGKARQAGKLDDCRPRSERESKVQGRNRFSPS